MKTRFVVLFVLTAVCATVLGQETKPATPTAPPKPVSATARPKLSAEELEAKFKATLSQVTLTGRWHGIENGTLTAEKEDKYTIVGVRKIGGDDWMIDARIQYGQSDFTFPLPVQVKWAGDTAVITVDGLTMPGGKTAYTARVLIFEKTYAGSWFGGDQGGLLSGLIVPNKN